MTRISMMAAATVLALTAGPASAADVVTTGKIKAINADNKEFTLTDGAGKDWTIKIGDNLLVNRAGKESGNDLKGGEAVCVSYEKGVLTWTARYVLVHDGDGKNCNLVRGTVKGYDAAKKDLMFTDAAGKDWTFPVGEAKVRLNREASRFEDIKIGDHALLVVETVGDKPTLRDVLAERAK